MSPSSIVALSSGSSDELDEIVRRGPAPKRRGPRVVALSDEEVDELVDSPVKPQARPATTTLPPQQPQKPKTDASSLFLPGRLPPHVSSSGTSAPRDLFQTPVMPPQNGYTTGAGLYGAPRMPEPRPYHPSTSRVISENLPPLKQNGKVVPIPINSQPVSQSSRAVSTTSSQGSFSVPPINNDEGETFNVAIQEEFEMKTSSDDALNAMKDLLGGAMGSGDLSKVDMKDAKVEGFADHIVLLEHQVEGRHWMKERESGKKAGGILADDMGLGKTIQTLVRIVDGKPTKSELRESGHSKTTLIVAPVSVFPQWAEEIERLAPGLTVIKHHGSNRTTSPEILKRADVVVTTYTVISAEHKTYTSGGATALVASKKKSKAKNGSDSDDDKDTNTRGGSDSEDSLFGKTLKGSKAKKAPAKAPSKSKVKEKPCALFGVNFWRIALDEAHNIKNKSSKTSLACVDLKSKYRWVLTGTPIQNSIDELFPLFRFLRVRPLNDWDEFSRIISKPVKSGKSKNAMKRLHVVLGAVMLRRTKDMEINGRPIIPLPTRTVTVWECEFDEEERAFYDVVESRMNKAVDKLMQNGEKRSEVINMLILLLRMRQACDHPSLLSKEFKDDIGAIDPQPASKSGDDDDEGDKDVDDLADALTGLGIAKESKCTICLTVLPSGWKSKQCEDCADTVAVVARRKSIATPQKGKRRTDDSDSDRPDSDLPPLSAKIREMLKILDSINKRTKGLRDEDGKKIPPEKTIIFSQFVTMLNLVEQFLAHEGIAYTRIDGSMKPQERQEALEKIRGDKRCRVILISFKAGGVGLNLTSCNNVILLDLWWNPALEDQAFDRAHRLGQKKEVSIYKLTVPQTVENRMLELQTAKRALAQAALSGGKLAKQGLSLDDLMMLFNRKGGKDDDDDDD